MSVLRFLTAITAASLFGMSAASPTNTADAAPRSLHCNAAALQRVLPPGGEVVYAISIPDGGSFDTGVTEALFPRIITPLPASCALLVKVPTSPSSGYDFAMWLPTKNYNGRFAAYGNGGFIGQVQFGDMALGVRYGFATVSTNTGHNSSSDWRVPSPWALNAPEKQIDWSHRALHGTVVNGKKIAEAFYGAKPKKSYYFGCSTGGRQGLKAAQKYPEDFDGVVAGAPAWWTTHLGVYSMWLAKQNLPYGGPGSIPGSLARILSDEIWKQCDEVDGVKDGIIMDPYACDFKPEALLCTPSSNKSECFTGPQLDTLKKMLSDWVDEGQTFVFPAFSLSAVDAGWATWLTDGETSSSFDLGFTRYMLYGDPNYQWTSASYQTIKDADRVNPAKANADNFDMSPFMKRGGKLIMYHGLSDNAIPAGSSRHFVSQVQKTMVPKYGPVGDFFRFFEVPGFGHCGEGVKDAPWYFASVNQFMANNTHGVPGFNDAKHDVHLAIMDWVEKGNAPDQIVATKFKDNDVKKGIVNQRPLCVYPKVAKHIGGDPSKASNWKC